MLSEKWTRVWKLFSELCPGSLGFCFSNLKSLMQQHYSWYLFIVESHRRGGTFHPHGIHVARSREGKRKQGLFSLGRVSPGLSWHLLSWQGDAVPKTGGRICLDVLRVYGILGTCPYSKESKFYLLVQSLGVSAPIPHLVNDLPVGQRRAVTNDHQETCTVTPFPPAWLVLRIWAILFLK